MALIAFILWARGFSQNVGATFNILGAGKVTCSKFHAEYVRPQITKFSRNSELASSICASLSYFYSPDGKIFRLVQASGWHFESPGYDGPFSFLSSTIAPLPYSRSRT